MYFDKEKTQFCNQERIEYPLNHLNELFKYEIDINNRGFPSNYRYFLYENYPQCRAFFSLKYKIRFNRGLPELKDLIFEVPMELEETYQDQGYFIQEN